MSQNQERIEKLKAQLLVLETALSEIGDAQIVDISKGNERATFIDVTKLEKLIRRKEMQILRAGGTL